ncbi:MAG: hypothetical protein M1517_00970 [Deltaproteobacteria bacterium]|nr:hypothetical protein [Deltaproteobacteria bacterium]
MHKKLTITMDKEVYENFHKIIAPRKISKFIETIVRPPIVPINLESAYARMAKDKKREEKATEWAETTFKDITHEEG